MAAPKADLSLPLSSSILQRLKKKPYVEALQFSSETFLPLSDLRHHQKRERECKVKASSSLVNDLPDCCYPEHKDNDDEEKEEEEEDFPYFLSIIKKFRISGCASSGGAPF